MIDVLMDTARQLRETEPVFVPTVVVWNTDGDATAGLVINGAPVDQAVKLLAAGLADRLAGVAFLAEAYIRDWDLAEYEALPEPPPSPRDVAGTDPSVSTALVGTGWTRRDGWCSIIWPFAVGDDGLGSFDVSRQQRYTDPPEGVAGPSFVAAVEAVA